MRTFVNSGHFRGDNGHIEYLSGNITIRENQETEKIRDELRGLLLGKYETMFVPDDLNLKDSIAYINSYAISSDFAIDIHLNASNDKGLRGTEAYYGKDDPKHAVSFSRCVANALGIKDRGAKPDSQSAVGYLGFLRQLKCPAVLVEVCYITNDFDRIAYTPKKAAEGIKNALDELFQQKVAELQKQISLLQKLINFYNQFKLMNSTKKFGAFSSSADNQKLALTVKGVLTGIIPFALWFAQSQGATVTESDLQDVMNAVVEITIAFSTLLSVSMTSFGLIRKLYIKFT